MTSGLRGVRQSEPPAEAGRSSDDGWESDFLPSACEVEALDLHLYLLFVATELAI
jgi:hypothetical protein